MRIFVIRHGESEADILQVHEGRADFKLTERGHSQAAAMAEYIHRRCQQEGRPLDKIYCSTLQRAAQTAWHLQQKTAAPLVSEQRLMEFNNGLLAGLPHSVVEQRYPEVTVPPHKAVYEQESALEFRFRAEHVLSQLLFENPADSTLAVVTHGGMIQQLYRAFLQLPVGAQIGFATGDAAVHEWLVRGDARIVLRANHLPHNL